MELGKILAESFKLLRDAPKVVLPRIITTTIYSVFILSSMGLAADIPDMTDPMMFQEYLRKFVIFTAFLPFLYFVDILSYAIYPKIVADYRAQKPINLTAALKDGLRAWRIVVALGLVIFMMLLFVTAITVVSVILTWILGNPIFIAFSVLLVLALIMFFAIIMFFVVPSAVIEGKSVSESFKESFSLGMAYKGDLLKLNMMFLALVVATAAMAYAAKSDSLLSGASIIVFILLRLVEAVVYTYLSVVNPTAYLNIKTDRSAAHPQTIN